MAFKLFPKVKRLPTLVGIAILVIGIGATTYLTQRVQQFFTKAEPTVTPQQVKISNLTSQAFTVSWITPQNPSAGYLTFGGNPSLGKVALDERDKKLESLGQYLVHHVTLGSLEPQTTYYFKIVSQGKEYDENGNPYRVTTLPTGLTSPLAPTYGTIQEENGQPAQEGVVYVKIGNSNLVSALIKPSGSWLVSLSSLSNPEGKGIKSIPPDAVEEIFVQGREKTSKAITTLKNNAPVPTITLGKDYDFQTPPSPQPTLTTSPSATPSFNLTQPASDAAVPGQPFFRGTGTPGGKVKIEVESENPLSGEVVIDKNGEWVWQTPKDLPPGKHTVTVTSTDSQGRLQAIVRRFIILASGTQVTEAATPSATPTVTPKPSPSPTPTRTAVPKVTISPSPTPTLTPTPTPTIKPSPTPTLKPSLSPTPTATGGALPESGDLLWTLILGAAGVFFVGLGFFFLKPKGVSSKEN